MLTPGLLGGLSFLASLVLKLRPLGAKQKVSVAIGTVIWDKLDAAFGLVIAVDAHSNIADTS